MPMILTTTAAVDIPPEIHVAIKKTQPHEKLIRIVVSNSNYNTTTNTSSSKATFSKQMLKSIFDFDRYHSSKRLLLKIYAAQKLFQVHVAIDRINQLVHSKIHDEADDDAEVTYYDDTKIEVTLPLVDGQNKDDLISRHY
jgi:hypothetical protein